MIFLNMYVHVLEAVVALLIVATAVQLFRCNRDFYQTRQIPNVAPPIISSPPKKIEKNYSTSGNILHDYIGEFFIDEAIEVELDEYKNAEVISVKSLSTTKLTAATIKETKEKEGRLENTKRSNVLSFEERAEASPDKTFSEEDDDTVITVMTTSTVPSGAVDDKVMSDKVVHAMLDEAKLICAS